MLCPETKVTEVGARAEWDPAKVILMHEPGIEAEILAWHYPSGLFQRPTSVVRAQRQHQGFVRQLEENHGAKVHLVRNVLETMVNESDLRRLASSQIWYQGEGCLSRNQIKEIQERTGEPVNKHLDYGRVKREVLEGLETPELVNLILCNPKMTWSGKQVKGTYEPTIIQPRPIGNLLFTRDQMITTKKGIVLGSMRTPQRQIEVDIMEAVLKGLGVSPIYRVKEQEGGGFLEGGDFFPMGDYCLLGIGSRTDKAGAMQLLENDVFGVDTVVFVYDPGSNQDRMHLDTYWNVLGPHGSVIQGDFCNPDLDALFPYIEVYEKEGGKYKKNIEMSGMRFYTFLTEEKDQVVVGVNGSMQDQLGPNFLHVGNENIVGIRESDLTSNALTHGKLSRRILDAYVRADRVDRLPKYHEAPYREVNNMFGGHHCTTQVISRQAPEE